jgi:hypothetical protein
MPTKGKSGLLIDVARVISVGRSRAKRLGFDLINRDTGELLQGAVS